MADVEFKNVTKKYGNFLAIKDFNLMVADHEFICLVGPSGCGKTTCLRMLAGLEDVTDGNILIDKQDVINLEPKNRDIAMVFQSYALYPHYSIYDNLAFGLRTRSGTGSANGFISLIQLAFYAIIVFLLWAFSQLLNLIVPQLGTSIFGASVIGFLLIILIYEEFRNEIRNKIINTTKKKMKSIQNYVYEEENIKSKIQNTANLLGIEEQLMKKPKQLSGGQRQRVALGRAIIRNPKVFLMDEPLSNLDAKLRVQMRAELQRLTKRLQVTTIYVTHDQIEAMTLGDRIAVLNLGELQQVGTPDELYLHPINKFVAGFIGSPAMNFIKGKIHIQDNQLFFNSEAFQYKISNRYNSLKSFNEKEVILGIRPEHILLSEELKTENAIQIKIGVLEPIGSDTFVYIDFPANITFIVKMEGLSKFKLDQSIYAKFEDNQIHFFDADSQIRILPSE